MPCLNPSGQENVLAVRVRNQEKSSRWYSGSSIYRHVWLTIREPVQVPTWGVFVTTPQVSKDKALVKISAEVSNATNSHILALVRARVQDAEGKVRRQFGRRTASGHRRNGSTEKFVEAT